MDVYLVVYVLTVLVSISPLHAYKAAVYEHQVTYPTDRSVIVTRKEALVVMQSNLDVYSNNTQQASKQGAQIIVFPEYGIYGLGWTRETILPYLEEIPNPLTESWNPCDNPSKYNDTDVQRFLSCMAKVNRIYVVVNFGSKSPCKEIDPSCPKDGHFLYSTNLVYDSAGKFVARYYKYNLYPDEIQFDRPTVVNMTVFSTPFGKFGTITSLDILYSQPTINLIENLNITNLAYPTAWKSELPLKSAIEFHSGFAQGMHVSILAANIHKPDMGYYGSGIYWPIQSAIGAAYYNDGSVGSTGELIVHDVSLVYNSGEDKPSSMNTYLEMKDNISCSSKNNSNNRNIVLDLENFKYNPQQVFHAEMDHDVYNFVPITSDYGDVSVCHGSLCCHTLFESLNNDVNNTLFAFGAFEGLHTFGERYYIQVCAFIKCANNSIESCGKPTNISMSEMGKMSFQGNFTTSYVIPEVVTVWQDRVGLVPEIWYYFSDSIIIDVGLSGNTLAVTMYGRDYSRDTPLSHSKPEP